MHEWVFDNENYKAAFLQSINDSKALDPSILRSISYPMCAVGTPEYFKSHLRVMIMGQETDASGTCLMDAGDWQALKHAIGGVVAFNFAIGDSKAGTPFWRAFQLVSDHFELETRRCIAWSNVVKVQGILEGKSRFVKLPYETQAEVLEWQEKLFLAELEFFSPNIVICFTGPDYDNIFEKYDPNFEIQQGGEVSDRTLRVGWSERFEAVFVRTYHPRYLQQSHQWHLIGEACEAAIQAHSLRLAR